VENPVVEKVARAIYAASGWDRWPLDLVDPPSDANEVAEKYKTMAMAAINAFREYSRK
jgi:hypothetical protein